VTPDRRPRVAIYDPFTPGLGGLYRYVQGVIDGLTPDRFDVTLFCHPNRPFTVRPGVEVVPVLPYTGRPHAAPSPAPANGPNLATVQTPPPLKPRRFVPGSALRVAGFLRSAWAVAPLFRGRGFDAIHTFETDADPAVLAARIAGVPRVVYTCQVDSSYLPPEVRNNPGKRLTEVMTDWCLSLGIAASEATRRDRLRRTHVGPATFVTIPNGIDTVAYARTIDATEARRRTDLPDDGRLLVGTVGRLSSARANSTRN
jgi:glycosyltransferase involved in cell wall biosynthesis